MIELSLAQKIIVLAPPVLLAITFHEVAHGYVARLCGDSTASMMGRLSLNPLKHIDLIGTILVPLLTFFLGGILFGWAKPMPVSWRNFRHLRRDMIFVAAAGPCANFIMALIWAALLKLALSLDPLHSGPVLGLIFMAKIGVSINLFLMIFNLLPIPPLDGSRVISALLPPKLAYYYSRLEPYGLFILLGLIFIGALNQLVGFPYILLQHLITTWFGLG